MITGASVFFEDADLRCQARCHGCDDGYEIMRSCPKTTKVNALNLTRLSKSPGFFQPFSSKRSKGQCKYSPVASLGEDALEMSNVWKIFQIVGLVI